MISITPFGQTGPNADLPATELTLFAACGQLWLTGDPARAPLKNGGSQPSYQAGLNAFAALAGAYYGALVHGQGAHIDLAMQETYAAMAEAFMTRASQLGIEDGSLGQQPECTLGHLSDRRRLRRRLRAAAQLRRPRRGAGSGRAARPPLRRAGRPART